MSRHFLGFDTPPLDQPEPEPVEVSTPDAATADDLAEHLTNLAAFARRQPYVIEKFTDDRPTNWTKAHRRINEALDRWQLAL